jgi:DNA primase
MRMDHMNFSEAIEKLAARAGITLRYEDGGAPGPSRQGETRTRILAANHRAAAWFAQNLHQDPTGGPAELRAGHDFLTGRGFPIASWERFGLGLALKSWDGLLRHMRAGGFSDAESLAAGLASQAQRGVIDRFRGRLVWPIRDAAGDVLGFGARKLLADDDGPKYLNTSETAVYKKSHVLYGLDLARREIAKRRQVVVVEGYTDVMAAHLAGVPTAVATCGTAFGAEHASILRRYLMDDDTFGGEVVFTFDGDAAGQKAALRAFAGDQKFVAQTFIAVSPDGMDPCDLRQARGDAAVRELVAGRTPLFEFAIRSLLAGYDLATAEGRVGALRQAAPLVSQIRDAALRPEYTRLLAGWLGMPEGAVRDAIAGSRPGRSGQQTPAQAHRPPGRADPQLVVEREALKCVLQAPKLLGNWYDGVTVECYTRPDLAVVHGAVAAAAPARGEAGLLTWIDAVLAHCPHDQARELVRQLAVEPVSGELDSKYAVAIVAKLLANQVGRQLAQMNADLSRMDPVSDAQQAQQLFRDVMALETYRRELVAAAGASRG